MMRYLLALAVVAALAGAPALADPSAVGMSIHSVVYQCPGEASQTFQYTGTVSVPRSNEVKLEIQWYWGRSRADRGAGCLILSVNGTPYQE